MPSHMNFLDLGSWFCLLTKHHCAFQSLTRANQFARSSPINKCKTRHKGGSAYCCGVFCRMFEPIMNILPISFAPSAVVTPNSLARSARVVLLPPAPPLRSGAPPSPCRSCFSFSFLRGRMFMGCNSCAWRTKL